jgi:multisubunit Na+/H+ antiporter MnhE subunit
VKRLVEYAAKWFAFVVLWFLFVYQLTGAELLAGMGAAALTVFALERSCKAEPFLFQPKLRWCMLVWRLPGSILRDFVALFHTLMRHALRKPSLALFQMTPFHTSGEPARQAAQRCVATLLMSLSPNSVVVDIDTEKNVMMFHQMEPDRVPAMIRELEEE